MFQFIHEIPNKVITGFKILIGEVVALGSAYGFTLNDMVGISALIYTGFKTFYLLWRWRMEYKGLLKPKSKFDE